MTVTKTALTTFAAKVIAADALSANFVPTQSLGEVLAHFLPKILGHSLRYGFSHYSAETCHESIHGSGSCSKLLARDVECTGNILHTPKLWDLTVEHFSNSVILM